jgi:thioredoxin reductase (NADPH)
MLPTDPEANELMFPTLDVADVERIATLGTRVDYADGDIVFSAGTADIDFFVVESGHVEIQNPAAGGSKIVTHGPRQFMGDIDLLTRRPVIVNAIARGPTTLIRTPGNKLRKLLLTVPHIAEKLLVAIQLRRESLTAFGTLGMRVVGSGHCSDTNLVREFLTKNFVPFTWFDSDTDEGRAAQKTMDASGNLPWVECAKDNVLVRPTVRQIAECAGVWRACPTARVNLAIVGAGPAGIAAAVYAASEGLNTIVLDELGPGGQAGGSSLIENFIGFPSGLSGGELATRGVLQMLKFGAQMAAPVKIESLQPSTRPGEPHRLKTQCGAVIEADVVLVATGARWKRLEAKGTAKFDRIGVHYACTTVEAELYDSCDVAVVGAANSAGQAAMYLAEACVRTVHMIIRGPELGPGMSAYLADRIRATPNIKVHTNVEIGEVFGKEKIEEIALVGRGGTKPPEDAPARLKVNAIFAFIGAEPRTDWLPDSIARDAKGYVLTGADMTAAKKWPLEDRVPCPLETSVPGILAAGDVRCGSTKRVGFAVGDGSLAVTCTHSLLATGRAAAQAAREARKATPVSA